MAFLVLLGNDDICATIRILSSLEVPEIAFRQELLVALVRTLELLFRENILLVDGIAFTKG